MPVVPSWVRHLLESQDDLELGVAAAERPARRRSTVRGRLVTVLRFSRIAAAVEDTLRFTEK